MTTDPVDGRTRELVARLARADFEGATEDFDFTMRSKLPPEDLARAWRGVVAQVGPWVAIEHIRVEQRGRYTVSSARCRFDHGEVVVQVTYDAESRVAGLFFRDAPPSLAWTPPAYAEPSTFDERDVRVGARDLPGVLTVPKAPGSFPAVVLVAGSGPADADESMGQIKVFKDLAFGLASRGVAVLRYMKRTRAFPRGVVTVKEEVIDDARAAVGVMSAEPRVDPRRVVLVGHSFGGYLVPRIASEDQRVAGLVILAGNTRPLQDVLVDQLRRMPAPRTEIDDALRLKAAVEDPALTADRPLFSIFAGATGAYFLDLRGYRPEIVAARLARPILVVRGDRDAQVSQADFDGWTGALGDSPRAQCKQYPGLNHAFVAGSGPSTPAEYDRPGHVERIVVEDVALWARSLPPRP